MCGVVIAQCLQVLVKALTEHMVFDAHCPALPVTIVRPSLVGALAGRPYPGFVGNLAGGSVRCVNTGWCKLGTRAYRNNNTLIHCR
jgi:hypothetical protein